MIGSLPADSSTPTLRHTSRGPLVSGHPAMQKVLGVLDRVAASACTVLVTGESGTGKELAVAALHDASPRAEKPLVTVNCGAIAANLVESELFGHARGAFTGAVRARSGFVAEAEGGTLFLDEVGELPLAVQVKLLRLLQQREYTPVGESHAVKADVRIVAATNRDLAREVAEGRFREDLYYRLDVIHVRLPSLRERRSDIALLATHFLAAAVERAGRPEITGFAPDALELLAAGDFPGNVRELENVVERAVLLSTEECVPASCVGMVHAMGHAAAGTLAAAPAPFGDVFADAGYAHGLAADTAEAAADSSSGDEGLFDDGVLGDGPIDLRARVESYENSLIRDALARTNNNKTKAARILGLHRTTLVEMLKRKRIDALPQAA